MADNKQDQARGAEEQQQQQEQQQQEQQQQHHQQQQEHQPEVFHIFNDPAGESRVLGQFRGGSLVDLPGMTAIRIEGIPVRITRIRPASSPPPQKE